MPTRYSIAARQGPSTALDEGRASLALLRMSHSLPVVSQFCLDAPHFIPLDATHVAHVATPEALEGTQGPHHAPLLSETATHQRRGAPHEAYRASFAGHASHFEPPTETHEAHSATFAVHDETRLRRPCGREALHRGEEPEARARGRCLC